LEASGKKGGVNSGPEMGSTTTMEEEEIVKIRGKNTMKG